MTVAFTKNFTKNQDASFAAANQASARASLSAVSPCQPQTHDADYLAHDTRNWLTVLQVYCDLLRTSGVVASGYQKWIDELSGAVERGHELVASLLDSVHRSSHAAEPAGTSARLPHTGLAHGLAHPDSPLPVYRDAALAAESALSSPVLPSLDVADAIARRLPLLKSLAGGNIQVKIDTLADVGKVALPESAFERILQNLVSNAIEAMPDGGCLRVALRRGSRGRENRGRENRGAGRMACKSPVPKTLVLRISDTGNGIPPERVDHIFEAGVSGKTSHENSGPRGFGLAIVRELTLRAGGTVRVRSHPGRGSCFEVELPRI